MFRNRSPVAFLVPISAVMFMFCAVQNICAQWAAGRKEDAAVVSPNVVISEIYGGDGFSPASTYGVDYIELFNRGTTAVDLSDWTIQYTTSTGTTWSRGFLGSSLVGPGQYFLAWGQIVGLPNSNAPPGANIAAFFSISPSSGKIALVNNSTLLTGACPTSPNIVDLVGYGPAANCSESAPAPSHTTTSAAIRAGDGCTDTDNNSADFSVAASSPKNTLSTPQPCHGPLTIHDIQGPARRSPYVGNTLTLTGIVTARTPDGFYIQLPQAEADADPNTSEAIFVFTNSAPFAAAEVGNRVSVTGEIRESLTSGTSPSWPTVTRMQGPFSFSVISSGNPLPAPVVLTADDTDGTIIDNLERFEGMRINVGSLTASGPTGGSTAETADTAGAFYGVITGLPRPFREPGITMIYGTGPHVWPPATPRFDTNPERIRVDSDGQIGVSPVEVTSNAVVSDITGVLTQFKGVYTVLPDSAPAFSGNISAGPISSPDSDVVSLATLDLLRFYDTVDDPGTTDIVVTPQAFDDLLKKTSMAVRTFMRYPDVIGVQKVENIETLAAIALRINSDSIAAGEPDPGYIAFLTEGNDPAGLDVGFLVKGARVDPIEVVQFGAAATYTASSSGEQKKLYDHPPLLLRATVPDSVSAPFPFTVIVNNLFTMNRADGGGITDSFNRARRRAQAEYLAQLIQSRQSADPAERIVTLGNFEAFQFNDGTVDVMGTIRGNPAPDTQVWVPSFDYVDPNFLDITDLLAAGERYTYVFEGNADMRDHILYTGNLAGRTPQAEVARIGADYPAAYGSDNTRPERVSDHDSPVLRFSSAAPVRVSVGGRVTNSAGNGIPGAVVTLKDQTGARRTVTVSPFGYYLFDNVRAEESYTISASAKRHRFTPRVITVFGELSDVNFTPN